MTQEGTEHNRIVREQFSAQAAGFERHVLQPGSSHIMGWILDNLELQPHYRVLDVAAGTGLVARAVAPLVEEVVASDATPAMLDEARTQAAAEGLTNIAFDEGDAAHLPYADGSFDMVTCRLGVHHFLEPMRQAREMVRVCRPGGYVCIFDITSTDVAEAASLHNELERLRDSSHTRALSLDEAARLGAGMRAKVGPHQPVRRRTGLGELAGPDRDAFRGPGNYPRGYGARVGRRGCHRDATLPARWCVGISPLLGNLDWGKAAA